MPPPHDRDRSPAVHETVLNAASTSETHAREWAGALLAGTDFPGARQVELLAGELVRDALRVGVTGPVVLTLTRLPHAARLALSSSKPTEPTPSTAAAEEAALRAIERLADDWGYDHSNRDETIWAEVTC